MRLRLLRLGCLGKSGMIVAAGAYADRLRAVLGLSALHLGGNRIDAGPQSARNWGNFTIKSPGFTRKLAILS